VQGTLPGELNAPPEAVETPQDASDRAGRLLSWLHTQGLEGYEKSFKMSARTLLENRFLAGLSAERLPPARLFEICHDLGMPNELVARLERELAGADSLHFGFEEGHDSAIFKLYLEYWTRLNPARQRRDESVLLHLALKWDAQDVKRFTVASYTCFPCLSREQTIARIGAMYQGVSGHPSSKLAQQLIGLAAVRTSEQLMYLEVSEEGNPRASFDLNLHAAGFRLADIEPQLMAMVRGYSIPPEQFASLWRDIADKLLGHLSGGLSRDGQDFVTIYYDPQS
jgi:tryptophan halogenase